MPAYSRCRICKLQTLPQRSVEGEDDDQRIELDPITDTHDVCKYFAPWVSVARIFREFIA